jgi:hypothetical protein
MLTQVRRQEQSANLQRQGLQKPTMRSRRKESHTVLSLQRSLGSQSLQRFAINQPGDRYEQEADRIADQVMRMPTPEVGVRSIAPIGEQVQRKCPCEEEDLQRKELGHASESVPSIVYEVLKSPGRPLDARTRAFVEPRFGYDFTEVQVHTDANAADSAKAVNSIAYTVGNQMVFGAGQYDPHSIAGKKLIAHELTHVIQQRRGVASPDKLAAKSLNGSDKHEATSSIVAHTSPLSSSNSSPLRIESDIAALSQRTMSKPVSTTLVTLLANELVSTIRDRPGPQGGILDAKYIGELWGVRSAETILKSRLHPAWSAFGVLPSATGNSQMSEVDDPGDSDDPTLMAVNGRTGCNLPLGLPWLIVTNPRCTAPCTLLHESTHFWDIAPCCVRAGIAYRAAPTAGKAAVAASWGRWINTNRSWFECRAYRVSRTCGTAISTIALCWAPERVVGQTIVAAATVAGALIGSQIAGAAGAGAGAGAGLAGGPAAPVTVPVGAAAGFISGELLGFLAGAGIGALAGTAAEAMRRRCCDDVRRYRATANSKISAHCASSVYVPCPF